MRLFYSTSNLIVLEFFEAWMTTRYQDLLFVAASIVIPLTTKFQTGPLSCTIDDNLVRFIPGWQLRFLTNENTAKAINNFTEVLDEEYRNKGEYDNKDEDKYGNRREKEKLLLNKAKQQVDELAEEQEREIKEIYGVF